MMRSQLVRGVLVMAVAAYAVVAQATVSVDMVTVGNAGNAANSNGYGSVDYSYQIGQCEITCAQYVEFLNAAAKTDTYGLWHGGMQTAAFPTGNTLNFIQRTGEAGAYTYTYGDGWADRPVTYVGFGDAARFCNWLANGQPVCTTVAEEFAATEDGSYYLNGANTDSTLAAINRKENATYVIPTKDEWYKAAYYDPTLNETAGGYWLFPTQNNTCPENDIVTPDSGNSANFRYAANSSNIDYCIGTPYIFTEVGEFELSDSYYGTFDQAGNVREWTENISGTTSKYWAGGSARESGDPISTNNNYQYMANTGCFSSNVASYSSSSNGIRIALVPEPGTMALLIAGVLGLLAYAYRRRQD